MLPGCGVRDPGSDRYRSANLKTYSLPAGNVARIDPSELVMNEIDVPPDVIDATR